MKLFRSLFLSRSAAVLIALTVAGCTAKTRQANDLKRAEEYFKAGEYDKAKIEYLNLLRKDPHNITAIERVAFIWSEQGAPSQAFHYLRLAKEVSPNNLDVRVKLATAYVTAGQVPDARKEVLAVLELSPAHEEALILLAETVRNDDDVAETERHLKEFGNQDKASPHLASAILSLRKGKVQEAESAVQKALDLEPKSAQAHLAMASILIVKKDPAQAGEQFKTAVELSPIRSDTRVKYAQFLAETGKNNEAKVVLKELTRQAPDYLPAWGLLAVLASGEKQFDEALALIENIVTRDPLNFDARLLQGQIWLAKGDAVKALAGLERLNTAFPNIPVVNYYLARAHLLGNNPVQAAAALTVAVAANPDYVEAILLLGELNLQAGNPAVVVTAMESLLATRPTLGRAQVILAEAYRSVGRLEDAAGVFRQQLQADPKNSAAHFMLGKILRQKNQLDEARKAFETAWELTPEATGILAEIVELEIQQKNFTAAGQRVRVQMQKTPGVAELHYLEGRLHWAQGQWDAAEAAFLKTLEIDANYSSAYELLISTYKSAGKLREAIAQLEVVAVKAPGNIQARTLLAVIYDRLGDYAKARETYEKILSLNPDSVTALNNLAYLYAVRLDQPDKAYELARKARSAQPSDASVADTLGWILYKRGDYQPALALLRESAAKLSSEPEVQYHLGMVSYMMGQSDDAATALRLAAKSPNDFPGKEGIERRLTLLGGATGKAADISVAALEAMLKQDPADLLAWLRLGENYEKEQAFAKAAAAYEQAIKRNSNLLSATTKLANLYAGPLQNRDKALEFAKKARELAPSDPVIAGVLGGIAYRAGSFTWAYSLLQESARQPGADAAALSDFAWTAYCLGKVSEARQSMQRVLGATPSAAQSNDAQAFLAMTALAQNPQDLAAAEPDIEKRLKVDPAYTPALMARAALQVQRGDAKGAVAIYTEILRRFPDFSPAQKYLAALYAGDPVNVAKGYDLAMKARRALPDDPELAETLAVLSYENKKYDYAVQLLESSAKIRPLSAKSLYFLGMSQWHSKKKSESRDTLGRALKAGLDEPLVEEATRVLKELDGK